MDDMIYAPATALARAIRAKEISAVEVVEAYLARIEAVNSSLNAVVQLAADRARAEARAADERLARGEPLGPLHGVPMTLKDNIDAAGLICTGGTKGRAANVPARDAVVTARMRAAGAILLGKTNLPEFCHAYETDNLIYGRTNNPYDLARTPGGSSGGEAAIIAAGGSPMGLGSDGGGSIRWPAHCCGIAGLKVTTGRVPRTGFFPFPGGTTDTFWQTGPLARFVADLAVITSVISGVDWRDPTVAPMPLGEPGAVALGSLRVAFHTDNGIAAPTPATAEAVRAAAGALAGAGLVVEEKRPEGIEQTHDIYYALLCADGGAGVDGMLKRVGTTEPHPFVQRLQEVRRANALGSAAELGALIFRWDSFRSQMLAFMEQYDVILCPVSSEPAPRHGRTFAETEERPGYAPMFSYTMTFNLTGWPAAVVRVGTSPEGLPIGVQIAARPWREDVALAVAQLLETALGGWQRPPL